MMGKKIEDEQCKQFLNKRCVLLFADLYKRILKITICNNKIY